MRFLMVHRVDQNATEAWNPSPEFVAKIGAMIQDWTQRGILITAEGVHPSEKGAKVRKARDKGITATDGPFTEAKEVIGGFALINAADLAEAVKLAQDYADLFDEIEVEVRQVVEFDEVAG
ncbi:YciI family protein [Kibdelosporangium persicum]|uniref:Transcriptional regulator n=1 Tax=Kibdelosporangium persicum TaxID=2698649 RepID=A0ABX2F708_9PSEU|nr:YciI family protein [Kibdelosporangium persicum]NRN66978.1 Transcriptional regulator [Kibdelosporangium persicum]